ncbi:serine threonine- kinase sgk2 protein [Rutstroemia sp. NJR-2017a BBW]|nr:serine threonine- kinase sgk2 protein [Rutstroemia sp. NJR-2017a BBW]
MVFRTRQFIYKSESYGDRLNDLSASINRSENFWGRCAMLSDVTGRCLEDGGTLHRDISDHNINIAESPAEEASKGRLIDLDLLKELNNPAEWSSLSIEVPGGNG